MHFFLWNWRRCIEKRLLEGCFRVVNCIIISKFSIMWKRVYFSLKSCLTCNNYAIGVCAVKPDMGVYKCYEFKTVASCFKIPVRYCCINHNSIIITFCTIGKLVNLSLIWYLICNDYAECECAIQETHKLDVLKMHQISLNLRKLARTGILAPSLTV